MNLFELFVKIGVDDQASSKLKSLSSKLGSGLKTAAKVGTAAVTAVGSSIAALGTYAAKVGGDFEAQMSKVSAISGATGSELETLKQKAEEMGIISAFSATEAGQAFEYMAMAGWKTEDMLNGVEGIMNLAAASGEDLALTSDIVTDALTAFGLSAQDSTHFADVLAAASSNANTNVAMMGETFKYVAPVAGSLGYSVEDVAVAIGLMANSGIKASQAGTSLRAMMARLSDATYENLQRYNEFYEVNKEVVDQMSLMETALKASGDGVTELDIVFGKLGITVSNQDGTMKDFDTLLSEIRVAMSGLTEEEKAFAARTIAGQEAMSGFLAIVNATDEDIEKLTASIESADGSAKKMADTMLNNLQGQLTLLKSSAEGFGLALYDKIQKPLTEMASWAVDSLNQLTTAFNEKGVDGLVEAAGNILSEAINEIVNGLPKIVDLAIRVIDSFVDGLNKNLDTIVSGAVSVVVTLTDGILNMLPEITKLGLDLIVSLANGISESLPKLIPTIIDVVLQIVETLTDPETLSNIMDAALVLIEELAKGLIEFIPELVSSATEIITKLFEFLTDPELLIEITNAAIDILEELAFSLIEATPQLVDSAIKIIENLVVFLTDEETLKNLLDAAVEITLALVNAILNNLDPLLDAAIGAIEALVMFLLDPEVLGQLAAAALDIIFALAAGLVSSVWKLIEAANELGTSIGEELKNMDWKKWGEALMASLLDGIKAAWESISGWFSEAWSSITSLFSGADEAVAKADEAVTEANAKIVEANNKVSSFTDSLKNTAFDMPVNSYQHMGVLGNTNTQPPVNITQNIYTSQMTPAEAMQEARYRQELPLFN